MGEKDNKNPKKPRINLKQTRELLGLSQNEVAKGSGITRLTYVKVETGVGDIFSETMKKIFEYLDEQAVEKLGQNLAYDDVFFIFERDEED